MAPHAHPHSSVTLVLRGEILECVGAREEIAGPLSVVVKPAGVIHSDTFGPRGAHTLQIGIAGAGEGGSPREAGGAGDPGVAGDWADSADAWMEGWKWHHAHAGVRQFVALARDAGAWGSAPPRSIESRAWEVLGALSGACDTARAGTPPPWLLRAREALDDRLADRLSEAIEVRELAECAGVHPISLTRAFKRHFGETVTEYRLRARLRRAVRLLATGSTSISAVAHSAGFSDHPHFCRAFRQATGVSPSDYRRLAGSV